MKKTVESVRVVGLSIQNGRGAYYDNVYILDDSNHARTVTRCGNSCYVLLRPVLSVCRCCPSRRGVYNLGSALMTPEGKIQKYAKERFEAIGGLVRKLSYEGRAGAPDLLVILPGGIVWFVEIKKDESTKPDPHQLREHERMRKRGANVFVVGSFKQVDDLIANYYSSHTPTI